MKNGIFALQVALFYLLLHFGCCKIVNNSQRNNDICQIRNLICMFEVTCFNRVDYTSDIFLSQGRCTESVIYKYGDYDYLPVNLIYKFDGDSEEYQPIVEKDVTILEIVTILDISGNQLNNQPVILAMSNLEIINLSHNNLSVALFYNLIYELKSLREIDFSYNIIINMEVSKYEYVFKELTKINLSHNNIFKISDFIFASFSDLQYLDLSNNQLSEIISNTFEGISKLKYLNLSYNKIIDINTSLSRFIYLTELNLSNNKISKVFRHNFDNIIELKLLDLSNNFISTINNDIFDNLSHLVSLDLSENKLQRLSPNLFAATNQLENINLSYNNITNIPKNMFLRKNISVFFIKGNNIMGPLERGLFEGLHFVTGLDISHQSVTSIGDYSFFGLYNMTKLLLNNNFICSLASHSFKTLKNLRLLDLSYNRITNIDFDKSDLVSLKSLALSNNLVDGIQVEHLFYLHRLQYLDLSHNNITRIQPKSFQSLTSLENILLFKNPLTGTLEEKTFDGLYYVPLLDMSGTSLNLIKNSSFDGMMHLYDLNISHSKIAEVQYNSFSNTENIETIDLSFNKLENFAVNTSHLKSLKNLQLDNNFIKILSKNFVKGLLLLNKITLSHNHLLTLHSDTFKEQILLNYLDLSFNLNFCLDFSLIRFTNHLDTLILSGTLSNMTFNEFKEIPLTRLDISNSNIHNISLLNLQKVKNIQILLLTNNNITRIDLGAFSNLSSIKEIDMSYNGIKLLEPGVFKDCHQLHSLNISHNNLLVIRHGIFVGLAKLNILDISYNSISDLEISRFADLRDLTELLVDHNNINKVSLDDLHGTKLQELSIGDNPLPCESLYELLKYSGPKLNITSIKRVEIEDDNHLGIRCNYFKHIPNQRIVKTEKNKSNETVSENLLIDIRDILFNISSKNIQNNDNSIINNKYDFEKSVKSLTDNIKQLNNISFNIEKENRNTNNYLERLLKLVVAINSFRPEVNSLQGNFTKDIKNNEFDKLKLDIENNITIEKEKMMADISDKLSVINQRIDSLKHSNILAPVNEHRTLSKEVKSFVFIEICVVLTLIILVCFVLYKVYKSRSYIVNRWSASTRHISEIENSNL